MDDRTKILVIDGAPAGSTATALLARTGYLGQTHGEITESNLRYLERLDPASDAR